MVNLWLIMVNHWNTNIYLVGALEQWIIFPIILGMENHPN